MNPKESFKVMICIVITALVFSGLTAITRTWVGQNKGETYQTYELPHSVSAERVELTEMTTRDMQIELNARGHNLVVDGKFGPKTNAALEMELQND